MKSLTVVEWFGFPPSVYAVSLGHRRQSARRRASKFFLSLSSPVACSTSRWPMHLSLQIPSELARQRYQLTDTLKLLDVDKA